jgi:DNA ligase (NAD+)
MTTNNATKFGTADKLQAQLTVARDAYYNGTPVMSDAAFDALEDELRKLDPNNAFFKKVGAPAPTGGAWPKVSHSIPMTSLNKVQTVPEFSAWTGSVGNGILFITEKLDGISIGLKYTDRKLVQAVTRGDGLVGEDITRNVLLMQGAVKMLPPAIDGQPTPKTVYVRGEIVCTRSDFKAHFPGESNPRNTASGTAKRQSDFEKAKHLTVIAYQLLPDGIPLDSKNIEFEALAKMGFITPNSYTASSAGEVEGIYNLYIKTKRAAIDYEIDGLVIDIADAKAREALGDLNGRPKGAVALKFPHDQKPTVLREIRWQVGNSGRITPVAIFDEVTLAGVQVERASLHTVRNVTALKLFPGCRVLVSRRNDCIPYLEANLDEGVTLDAE